MLDLKAKEFYIYGGSLFGKALTEYFIEINIPPKAILDIAPKQNHLHGIPIKRFPLEPMDFSLPVLVSILGYDGVEQSLSKAGFHEIIATKNVFEQFPLAMAKLNRCGFMWMSKDPKLQFNKEKCHQFRHLLSDGISKKLLDTLCDFRRSPSSHNYPWPSSYDMYFPDDLVDLYPNKNLRILDVGAYDGDTFEDFWTRYKNNISQYLAIEASPSNITKFESRLKKLQVPQDIVQITPVAVGLPENEILVIRENGSASQVEVVTTPTESDQIVVRVSLSELLSKGEFNIIKMDIEGADYDALVEGADYIATNRPHLALSLYHKPEDLWRIPLFIEDLAPNQYDFYLRQEGHWGLETQLYAKPKQNKP